MADKSQFIDDAFIARWIRDELSEIEAEELRQWLADNPDEAGSFVEMKRIWETYAEIKLTSGQSEDKRWQKILRETGLAPQTSKHESPASRNWRAMGFTAAAVILLGFFAYWQMADTETLTARRGERISHVLVDGSAVTLSAESSLQYSSEGWLENRVVSLSGEAFFDVASTGAPFSVETEQGVIEVIGTSFNIRARGQQTEVACATGIVRVRGKRETGSVVLNPGFATRIATGGRLAEPYSIDVTRVTGWLNGKIYFQSLALSEVFDEIARQFDIQIEVRAQIAGLAFTGVIDTSDLNHTLGLVCQSSGLKYAESNESTFVISE